jgi:hypothetical protein
MKLKYQVNIGMKDINPIGVFEVYYGEIIKEEQDIDEDEDRENILIWDD